MPAETPNEERIGRRIALVSMSVGCLLAITKIFIGYRAGSTAVMSDGFEAAGDVLSSAIVYAGLWLASRPPDDEHPYGHGRYETLAGLAIGTMLLFTGVLIFWHGFRSLDEQSSLQVFAIYPLLAAIVVKVMIANVKFRVGRQIASTALETDGWHDITDLLSTSVALIAVILTVVNRSRFGRADHVGGMIIGFLIFFLSIELIRKSIRQLLDTMPEKAKIAELRSIAIGVPGAAGIEKCYARRTGLRYHVDLHLEVNPEMTVRESHEIATRVRFAIKDNLRWVADVLVHVEPAPGATALRTPPGIAQVVDGK